ncbi:1-aminocyclopropane-1-carboxylate deaminase/D-cysteine desulfhydrase [Sulfurovum sp. bin170]|uniref:1-aminocyclopropane-1-carboxylate deaminase/D-cysteine desulfhydrase n=1 Tax=Sulfurovum sp. bin170 TaxID=2695268 RepID=UPI0013DFF5A3|nr:1-aminocyclopropane-1-carboxylate deaminase/D-cysteine desulfhydrase [Sulfurovum sp. bin170]NEW60469.1 1-aminocyclopropane-1-carboxylate deaminase/D-cysteine desulfhydrase [Sulfurovum sp. bin170]
MNINRDRLSNSPIEKRDFRGREIYIKRDDLLDPEFSGNKARKFYYFLINEFPHVKKVVAYGSNQSNAMFSLSVLAKIKGWEFEYYTDHLSSYLRENPVGNYKNALANGMRLIVGRGEPKRADIEDKQTAFVEEGGRQLEAKVGIKMLAQEIKLWQQGNCIKRLNIFLPSGTGTTALFLQKSLLEMDSRFQAKVYTVPCVGDIEYLKLQFSMLEENILNHPSIVKPSKKYHFGKLYRESYKIWLELRDDMGIEFDMLYDPVGWLTLMANPKIFREPTLYIHQGGHLGNESMLMRYERKYGEDI